MKIRCEKKDLLTAVSNVSRAAPAKSPIPALEGILFEAANDGLKLTAYDTRIGIYTRETYGTTSSCRVANEC